MHEEKERDYVVVYRSNEHYEVLGFVRAHSMKEAQKKAKKSLAYESKWYGIENAMVFEITNGSEISFSQL